MYDLIVVGAGPGGYTAAIRAAELGLKVGVVSDDIGGTCINNGCIPTTAYLEASRLASKIGQASELGITTRVEKFDLQVLKERKDQISMQLQMGVRSLFKSHHIDFIGGHGIIKDSQTVLAGEKKLKGKKMLLATGSRPKVVPFKGLDQVDYLTTEDVFSLTELPDKLTIIGGDIFAVDMAFVFAPLGAKVTMVDGAPDILGTEDPDAREVIKNELQNMGVEIHSGVKISEIKTDRVLSDQGESFEFDKLLVVTGRQVDLTVAEPLDLELDEKKRHVKVDRHYQTSLENVYAVGDLIGGYMLAGEAMAEGMKAAAAIADHPEPPVDRNLLPLFLHTEPEVAHFGYSEKKAAEEGYDVQTSLSSLAANGRNLTSGGQGFVKIISEKKYHQILGAVVVGPDAIETLHTIIAVVQCEGTVDELSDMLFAHPTYSEAINDAARVFLGKSTNK
ncbi:MAG TPA: NAD(P)/FAD-dependent oxidoreductase [Candidatus Ligilactobacillus excrementavium]|nr:NAD(P)/FAD-dependent oxidoreductase [Candidatus Ligilactobacillus excrementavium]